MLLGGGCDMLQEYTVFYADDQSRLQAMMLCSFNDKIVWTQQGLGIVVVKYKCVGKLIDESISQVYKRLKVLNVDKRRKKFLRSIGMGDVICVADQSWIVTTQGFQKIPDYLWNKVRKQK